MINLITAIGNQYINEKIQNIRNYNVVLKDIQYREGILEILSINQNIDMLLISTNILEEKIFIEKIREKFEKLEIIIFIDKKFESDITYFNSKRIYKIYLNNEKGYEECLKNLNYIQKNITEQVRNDMKDFKKEILKTQNKKIKKNNFLMNKKEKNLYILKNLLPRVIMISGARGVRKKYFFINFF